MAFSEPESFATFHNAARAGDAEAQYQLGSWYMDGALQSDRVAGVAWIQKAAEQGHPSAQYVLGMAYWSGEGPDKCLISAYKWLSLSIEEFASADGEVSADAQTIRAVTEFFSPTADEAIEKLQQEMSAGEIREARKEIFAWLSEQTENSSKKA